MKRFLINGIATALVVAGWLAIATWPLVASAQPSLSHVTPGAVAPGTTTEMTLHGTELDGTLPDYYRFTAKAGERISCEVVATRLGWDFDPLVRVLNAAGHELLVADDDSATGADSRLVFTAPADGQYLLELRDNRYKPGGR